MSDQPIIRGVNPYALAEAWHTAPAPTITDERVERALAAYEEGTGWVAMPDRFEKLAGIRAALEAALLP